jgi:branched-chain amino acid transport system ATP-binding protein
LDALSIRNLHAYYGKAHILQGIDLHLPMGRIVGILGRNGAGKTTLLRSIMGLVPRVEGTIELFDRSITSLSPDLRARAGIALMSQDIRVFPELTVEENCRVAASTVGDALPLSEVLKIIPELKEHLKRPAGRLSGGQQQLVALARSLSVQCRMLMLDEPTEGLMPSIVQRIGEIIQSLAQQNVTVLLVEQNISLGLAICTDLHFMEKGRLVAHSTPQSPALDGLMERYLGVQFDAHA